MKIPTLLLALWAVVSSSVAYAQEEAKWEPIIGFPSSTSSAFVDSKNRITRYNKDGDKLNSLTILIVSSVPKTVVFKSRPTETKSIATRLLVNCKSGLVLPIVEFYYNTDTPKIHDRPVGIIPRSGPENISEISKTSVMYQIACPEYI
jgi:hypothetical protein